MAGGGSGRSGHSITGTGMSLAGGGGGAGAASLIAGSAIGEIGRDRHRLGDRDRDRDRHRREEREERRGRSEDRRRGGGGGGRDSGRRVRADSRDEEQAVDLAPPQEEEPEEGELVIDSLSATVVMPSRPVSPPSRSSRWGNAEDVGNRRTDGRGEQHQHGEPRGGPVDEPRLARDRGGRATATARDGATLVKEGAETIGSKMRSAEDRDDGELQSVPPRGKAGVRPDAKERSDAPVSTTEPVGNSCPARQRRPSDDKGRDGSDVKTEQNGGVGHAAAAAAKLGPAGSDLAAEKARARSSGSGERGLGTDKTETDRERTSGGKRRSNSDAGVVASNGDLAGASPETERVDEKLVSPKKGLGGARGEERTAAADEKAGGSQSPQNAATVGTGTSSAPSTDVAGVKALAVQASAETRKVSSDPVDAAAKAEKVASAPMSRQSSAKSLSACQPSSTEKDENAGPAGACKASGDDPGTAAAAAAVTVADKSQSGRAEGAAVVVREGAQKTRAASGSDPSERKNGTPGREASKDAGAVGEGSNTGGSNTGKGAGSNALGAPSQPAPLARSSSGRSASGDADPPTRRSTGGEPGELTSFLRKNHRRKPGEHESPAATPTTGQSNREPGLSEGASSAAGNRVESPTAAATVSGSPAKGQRLSAFARLGTARGQAEKDPSSAARAASEGLKTATDPTVRRAPVGLAASWGSGSSVDGASSKMSGSGGGGGGGGGTNAADASKPSPVRREKGAKEEKGARQAGGTSRLMNAALVSSRESGRRGRRSNETGARGGRGRDRDVGGSGGIGGADGGGVSNSNSSKDQ